MGRKKRNPLSSHSLRMRFVSGGGRTANYRPLITDSINFSHESSRDPSISGLFVIIGSEYLHETDPEAQLLLGDRKSEAAEDGATVRQSASRPPSCLTSRAEAAGCLLLHPNRTIARFCRAIQPRLAISTPCSIKHVQSQPAAIMSLPEFTGGRASQARQAGQDEGNWESLCPLCTQEKRRRCLLHQIGRTSIGLSDPW